MSGMDSLGGPDNGFERQKWAHELGRRDAERAHDRHDQTWNEQNKSAVETANIAIRCAILINGGAAVSLLAFIGSLAAQGRVANHQIDAVATSLLWFACGVAAALVTAVGTYFVSLLHADGTMNRHKIWQHPYVEDTPVSRRLGTRRKVVHVISIGIGLISVVCFVYGIFDVRKSISKLGLSSATFYFTD